MLNQSQIKNRSAGIGGSDVAAVLGLSKWKTPFDVWEEKTQSGRASTENRFTYWGTKLEEMIADEYAIRTGKKLAQSDTVVSAKYPWMLANVDRLIVDDNAVLECKTGSFMTRQNWGAEGSDDMPTPYLLQCAHYAVVLESPYVDLAVLLDGSDYRIYRYHRNEKLEQRLIERERTFWHENVVGGVVPAPITSKEANSIFTAIRGSSLLASDRVKNTVKELERLKEVIKESEEKKDRLERDIKLAMGEHEALVDEFDNVIASWRQSEWKWFDVGAFKQSHPKVYLKYLKARHQRRFVVKAQES